MWRLILTAFIDLDGVLADFQLAMCEHHNVKNPYLDKANWGNHKMDKCLGMKSKDFWKGVNFDFWADMKWTHDGKELLYLIEDRFGKENCCIFTKVANNPNCASGKMEWIHRNMPDYRYRFLIGTDKHYAAKGNMLFDDNDGNIEKFNECGGTGVLIKRPWNSGYIHLNDLSTVEILGAEFFLNHILD